jgi:type III pantothenate kinase
MILLDIGNTRVKAARSQDFGRISDRVVYGKQDIGSLLDYIAQYPKEPITYLATGDISDSLQTVLNQHKSLHITGSVQKPFSSDYTTLSTMGADRLAVISAAHKEGHSQAVLIIDAGTCITYDLLDSAGVHRGGLISPGLQMRLQAMAKFTSALPLVSIPEQLVFPGNSTESAIQGGGLTGFIAEIEGIAARFQNKYGTLYIYISGGDAGHVISNSGLQMHYDPDMVFKGLYILALCQ